MRRAVQPPSAEPNGQDEPDPDGDQHELIQAHERPGQSHTQGPNGGVVAPGWVSADALPVAVRELLEQERIEHALSLLTEADAPGGRPYRMNDDGRRDPHDTRAPFQ